MADDIKDDIVKVLNLASEQESDRLSLPKHKTSFKLGFAIGMLDVFAKRYPEVADDIRSELERLQRSPS